MTHPLPKHVHEYEVVGVSLKYGQTSRVLLRLGKGTDQVRLEFGLPQGLRISWGSMGFRPQVVVTGDAEKGYRVSPWEDSLGTVKFRASSLKAIPVPVETVAEFDVGEQGLASGMPSVGRSTPVEEVEIVNDLEGALSLTIRDPTALRRLRFEDPSSIEILHAGGDTFPRVDIVDVSDRGLESRRWQIASDDPDERITFWAAGARAKDA